MMKSGYAIELSSVFNYPEETYATGRPLDAAFSKTMRKLWVQFAMCGNPSFSVEISPDGKALEWPLCDVDNKYVLVFDEFDIHVATEPEVGIVDWDRTYFLPNHYDIWGDSYFSPSGVAFGVMLSGSNEA